MASIIVHGGAGDFGAAEERAPCVAGCLAAARAGHAVLAGGGTALEAVVAAVVAWKTIRCSTPGSVRR